MDALQISGKWYISSRRAAKENGYHIDYIGQLIRTGKVKGQKVGRSWYVLADSLTDYLEKEGGTPTPKVSPKKKMERPAPVKKSVPKPLPEVEEKFEEEEEEDEVEVMEDTEKEKEAEPPKKIPPSPASALHIPAQAPMPKEDPRQEHSLLTYLQDDEPVLPTIVPTPIIPTSTIEVPVKAEEGTRIPIHATVKRWSAAMQRGRDVLSVPGNPIHRLGSVEPRRTKKRGTGWLPLLLIGTASFALTVGLSVAISSNLSSF